MENLESTIFGLRLIATRSLSPQDTEILKTFALQSPDEAALQFDYYCPPTTEEAEVGDYLWAIWDMMVCVVRSPDATPDICKHLISILRSLVLIARGQMMLDNAILRLWADLPSFSLCMHAWSNSPFEDEEEDNKEFTPELAQMWRNFSSFAARCTGAAVLGPWDQVIDAMKVALEEDLGPLEQGLDLLKAECKVQVACEWITHGGARLISWAWENVGYRSEVPEEDRSQYFPGGPLYEGPPIMCLQRWNFWQKRLKELGDDEGNGLGEEARRMALEAAQTMRLTERRVANIR